MFTPDMTIRYKYSMPSCVAYNHTMQLEQHAMNAAIQSVRSVSLGRKLDANKLYVACMACIVCFLHGQPARVQELELT